MNYRKLSPAEISQLERQGCSSPDWGLLDVAEPFDAGRYRNVRFIGKVSLAPAQGVKCFIPGVPQQTGIYDATVADCTIGRDVFIHGVRGALVNLDIEDDVRIESVFSITCEGETSFGNGVRVSVLSETGGREVSINTELSAPVAYMEALYRHNARLSHRLAEMSDKFAESRRSTRAGIGRGSDIANCGMILNVDIQGKCKIHNAPRLKNGTIRNATVGAEVVASDFIIMDGARVEAAALVKHSFVGQASTLSSLFSAHDSLFFCNCHLENGESAATFAGPFTNSMHKSTLLIGGIFSFFNAGSGTNQSNHMYKLGPTHWGVLERGVKTSSGSYLMLGANIGAFSLLMGQHKTHPDSTEFPFSYLFGDPQGATVVVPAVMLRSCGLLRDEMKWPQRDRRKGMPRHDRIVFSVLNPVTVNAMIEALDIIRPMLSRPADDDHYHRYKGMKLSRASLHRAMKLYYLGITKYLAGVFFPQGSVPVNWTFPTPPADPTGTDAAPWVDIAGLPLPRPMLEKAVDAESVTRREEIFDDAFSRYQDLQLSWIAARFPEDLRLGADEILDGAAEFDRLVELDRSTYRDSISAELAMLGL